jgi:N-acetyl-1-D-myo-inositol-2-amino-2-deoxy-alpha-D-glucopyranoside deacetylase
MAASCHGYAARMSKRLLLVHAHPDDETIGTGVTMAKYVADGAQVTLVTCTLGEEGEILLDEFTHLAADQQDALGEHRMGELGAAMAELGVTDWRLLGGPGGFRDSGMIGTPSNEHPDCFWRADLLAAAAPLVEIIREVRPQVMVTYDEFGGYGHPDHIQAHRVAHYAADLAAAPSFRPDLGSPWQITKIYWTAFPKSVIREGIAAMREQDAENEFAMLDPDDIPFACDDELVTTVIDGGAFLPNKIAAMRAHATQINVDGGFFALSNNVGAQAFGHEYYRLVQGECGPDRDGRGMETDLFSGVDA